MLQRVKLRLALAVTLALFALFIPTFEASAAPAVTFSVPKTLNAPLVVAFSEPVKGVTTSNIGVRIDTSSVNLQATLQCRTAADAMIGCASGPASKAIVAPASPLIPGAVYGALVNPAGAAPLTDMAGSAVAAASSWFRAPVTEQEQSAAASYRWRTVSDSKAYGGSYSTERLLGSRATFRFTGNRVSWYTITGPDQGIASVYLDGRTIGTYDQYSSSRRYHVRRSISGLTNGYHRLVIAPRGTKRSAASGSFVTVDAFSVDGSVVGTPIVQWQWRQVSNSHASAGTYASTNVRAANVYFTFRGPGIDWLTMTGPDQGIAEMYIDGVLRGTFDHYSSSTRFGIVHTVRNMAERVHTLRIIVTGKKNSHSRGTSVAVDAFVVRLVSVAAFRDLGAWVDLYDYGVDPKSAIAAMHSHGVKTLYLQTSRYSSSADIVYPSDVDIWLLEAHRVGMKVVGWYLPAYSEYMDTDVRRTVAIAKYRSPAGQRFDALGIDIEYKGKTSSLSEFNSGIVTHLDRVRSGAGSSFTVAAIVPSPIGMSLSPSSWTGFPWSQIGRRAHVVMPMAYWSYRTDCGSNPAHCPRQYTIDNVNRARSLTNLPVHVIGGIGNDVSSSEVSQFVDGARAAHAYGGSLYDYRTTASSYWPYLGKLNLL
jgi:hypothetical protein